MTQRLRSLDDARGFVMIWILGIDALFQWWSVARPHPLLEVAANQLSHVEWEGFHFYDLIFPCFIFLSGMAVVFSQGSRRAAGHGNAAIARSATRRAAMLIALGVIYNYGWDWSVERFRLASVLGTIGVAYWVAAVTALYVRRVSALFGIACLVLLGTTVLQLLVPFGGNEAGQLTAAQSINAWIDRHWLPGRMHGVSYDPEGILGTVSASFISLIGVCVGRVIVGAGRESRVAQKLLALGALLATLGFAVSPVYPIIKSLWAGSFLLVSTGLSVLLLLAFYLLTDRLRLSPVSTIFGPIGRNAIAAYLFARFAIYPLYNHFGPGNTLSEPLVFVPVMLILVTMQWLLWRELDRRKFYLRV